MIEKHKDYLYNIILSIFIGIMIILLLDQIYEKPRVVTVNTDKPKTV